MSKIIDFMNKHANAFIIFGAVVTVGGMTIGAINHNKERDRKLQKSMPDSYWDSLARQAEAKMNERIELAKIEADAQVRMNNDELEAMKSMPDGYFEMETAKILRDASIKSAKIDAEAKAASAREQRLAINNTVEALTKSMKENK